VNAPAAAAEYIADGDGVPGRTALPAGDRTLFLTDLRLGVLVLNEMRYRAIARLFGVSREQANLVSLVALMLVAGRLRDQIARLNAGPPSSGDTALAGTLLSEVLSGVAGPASRETPWTGALLTLALLAGARPAIKKAAHGMRTNAHRGAVSFHRRYGWLVDPGHLRQRRAQRRG
jgi:hypothetical protein